MKKALVLGAGMMGRTIAKDLSKDFKVSIVDKRAELIDKLKYKDKVITTFVLDIFENRNVVAKFIDKFDIVAGALPGSLGYKAAELVLGLGKDYVDISFAPEDLRELDGFAKINGARCLIDFGVAPGLSHLVYGNFSSILKKIDKYHIYVGGISETAPPPWSYKAPFSPADVIEEYTRPARFIEDGKVKTLPALSLNETICCKGYGAFEAFLTDGVRTLLDAKNVNSIIEKTIRPIGYSYKIKLLIDLGFFSNDLIHLTSEECKALYVNSGVICPRKFTEKLLIDQWKMNDDDRDVTIMRLDIIGKDLINEKVKYRYWLFDRHDGINSSMARTTGFMCATGVRLLSSKLWNGVGVFAPEVIGANIKCFKFIISELEKHNILLSK